MNEPRNIDNISTNLQTSSQRMSNQRKSASSATGRNLPPQPMDQSGVSKPRSNCITTYRGRTLDIQKMQDAFKSFMKELREDEAPILHKNSKTGSPAKNDRNITVRPLTIGMPTSTDLSLLDPLEQQVLQAVKNKEGTFRECAKKYGFTCACSTRRIDDQSRIEKQVCTSVPFTDENNSKRYMKVTKWWFTFECPCTYDDMDVTLEVFDPNADFHPKIVKSVDETMRNIIRDARFEWFKKLFENNKWNVNIGSREIYLCLPCKRTSIYGDHRDIKHHLKAVHKNIVVGSNEFNTSLVSFYFYKNFDAKKRGMPKSIDIVINNFLKIELFPQSEIMAMNLLKENRSSNLNQQSSKC